MKHTKAKQEALQAIDMIVRGARRLAVAEGKLRRKPKYPGNTQGTRKGGRN